MQSKGDSKAFSSSKSSVTNTVKFYLSETDKDANMCALLILLSNNITFEVLPSADVNSPIFPAISIDSTLIFGSGAIARYVLYSVMNLAYNDKIEAFLNIYDYQLGKLVGGKVNEDILSKINSCAAEASIAHYFYPTLKNLLANIDTTKFPVLVSTMKLGESSPLIQVASKLISSTNGVDFSNLDWSVVGLLSSLRLIFTAAIKKAFKGQTGSEFEDSVVVRCNPTFGDFQCNNALAIAKSLKGNSSYTGPLAPKDIASLICNCIPANKIIDSVQVAPNGFINITLSVSTLVSTIADISRNGVKPPNVPSLNVLVDFSSPNIAKEMHVGHLRSTIIGDSLCRILEFCGHNVMRVNHVGDWGTQFGMLITYLTEAYPDILTNPPNISDLTAIYKESKRRFDADEDFKKRSRLNVTNLQSGDENCRKIWTLLCDISRKEFQRVYDALGVDLQEYGESFYNPMIPGTINKLRELGLVYEEEGMVLLKRPNFTIPLILRKSDGGYGYDSTDMAAIYYRLFELSRDWIIVITDDGQSTHFEMIFEAAKAANWITNQRVNHIGFGVVQGEDGKKFKTRSGDTVRLIDLLNAARDRMKDSLILRKEEEKTSLTDEELERAAEVIGYGAVKYFDLKQHPSTNYIFSYDRMLDTRGDTAVYLLFAFARLTSILRKAQEERSINIKELSNNAESIISIQHPAERALGFELLMMNDVLKAVLADLLPNKLCDYLKDLSVKVTDFVTKCHVLNAVETHSRLLLCEATRQVLQKCFDLLGIKTLERI